MMGVRRTREQRDDRQNAQRVFPRGTREALIVLLFFMMGMAFFFHLERLKQELVAAAYSNLEQSMGQVAQTIGSTWTTDGAGLVETSGILAHTENQDEVLQCVEQNDVVYRYLFVPTQDEEAVASDGTVQKRNDSHVFTEQHFVEDLEVSEAFLSKSGDWCYLYRYPVKREGNQFGWLYAQYLFDRVHSLLPEHIYNGEGNYFILDMKTETIVFMQDEVSYRSVVGEHLHPFISGVLGGKDEVYQEIKNVIGQGGDTLISDTMGGVDTLIFITPIEGGEYYLMGITTQTAVMRGSKILTLTEVFTFVFLTALFGGMIIVLYIIRIRVKARREMDRAREEHNRNLQKALDDANAANQSKSRFLANMSHEIRTPINAVIGMNEMILRESKDPTVLEYSKDIADSAHSLLNIVNDILDLNKVESGKMEIIREPYDLEKMIQSLRTMLRPKAYQKGIALEEDLDRTLPRRLCGDELRIRQVVMNLATNAIKYTEEGSVTIRAKGKIEGKRVAITVEVEDTGIGIKEEDIPKLTEKFCRIEESRNRHIEGTGLGINITVDLLELMGSKLEVRSEYGKGSVFSFVLWQDIVDETPIVVLTSKENQNTEGHACSFETPNARILVVDDNRVNLKVMTGLLRVTRACVQTAESGKQCLELTAKEHFDLIFMDHMMPEMDGIETFHKLRKQDGLNGETPVVALTANAIVGAKDQYLAEGFSGYLSKPIDYLELEEIIRILLPESLVTLL